MEMSSNNLFMLCTACVFIVLWDKFLCRGVLVLDADAVYLTQNCFFFLVFRATSGYWFKW